VKLTKCEKIMVTGPQTATKLTKLRLSTICLPLTKTNVGKTSKIAARE